MKSYFKKHTLKFKQASGTSRGVLHDKETWLIWIEDKGKTGIGECGLLRGLSCDDLPDYEEKLEWTCSNISLGEEVLHAELVNYPSIQMGIETAFLSLKGKTPFTLYENPFSEGEDEIPINGLVWMGDKFFMLKQIEEKLEAGFSCIKMKVGAIDFDEEIRLLQAIRSRFSSDEITLRVDANGAFGEDALDKLNQLAPLEIHSIEQPIKKGNFSKMRDLCRHSPIPIALDEELIGVTSKDRKIQLLEQIQPQYIILKPSFIGGFRGANEWLSLSSQMGIESWVTSALESNIGLNAIAQWTYAMGFSGPQGLGTGSLYTNNFPSPLLIKNGYLSIEKNTLWTPLQKIVS